MQLHIAGNFFISVERETRRAGGCGIPRPWLSEKKQVSGQVHILNNTPLILAFLDGTEEDINWYNPNNPTKILHATDLVEVLVLREFKDDNFLSIVKLVRFCAYNLKRAKTDSSKESRAEVLKCLYEDIELRKLIALYVLKTSEDKVMKPKALQQLLEYNITSKMLSIKLNILNKYYLTEKDTYNRIKTLEPSLLSFDEVLDLLYKKSNEINANLVKRFTVALANHNESSDDQLRAVIPKLKEFLESK